MRGKPPVVLPGLAAGLALVVLGVLMLGRLQPSAPFGAPGVFRMPGLGNVVLPPLGALPPLVPALDLSGTTKVQGGPSAAGIGPVTGTEGLAPKPPSQAPSSGRPGGRGPGEPTSPRGPDRGGEGDHTPKEGPKPGGDGPHGDGKGNGPGNGNGDADKGKGNDDKDGKGGGHGNGNGHGTGNGNGNGNGHGTGNGNGHGTGNGKGHDKH